MSCPCGTGRPFEACCGPYLAGALPPTAEALMRSRYTAYARGEVDYVFGSHDPATRKDIDEAAVAKWSRESQWLGLEVRATERGGVDDDEGTVEFVARWRDNAGEQRHHERSLFRRVDGRWFYVDGQMVKGAPAVREERPGRNDPCPCGSGKKYKKCHGA
jgi:SEC-C motif-containing protein